MEPENAFVLEKEQLEKEQLEKRIERLEGQVAYLLGFTREFPPTFSLASVEKLHIQRVLNYTHGNKAEAARLLNIGLTTVYRKMEEYGLE